MSTEYGNTFEIRVAEILGTTPGEPLPPVNEETLATFHKFIDRSLSPPLPASFPDPVNEEKEEYVQVTLTGLLPLEDHPDLGPYFGLLSSVREDEEEITVPLAKVELKEEGPEQQLIDDYSRWYWEYR